ncbi:hypothetical protein CROQUDRAFT_89369 [Cronartium quercuum f. sp. fusiforme G11]|uniref:Uncharacterized protein n=1 Tax=Cronartium quercuum f. sp. fusiforme G11 TaxID=708437 RepID=A0A9P6NTK8_9BASI|nr:hypothetical protein CROQUDRAFT_89369 [Cronartium quercuum f. sp. fusiforme G11]
MASLATKPKTVHRVKSDLNDSLLEEHLKIANVLLPEDNLEDLVQLRIAPELVSRRLRARQAKESQSPTLTPHLLSPQRDGAFTPTSSSENDSGSSKDPRSNHHLLNHTASSRPITPLEQQYQHQTASSSSHNLQDSSSSGLDTEDDASVREEITSALGLGKIPPTSQLPKPIRSRKNSRLRSASELTIATLTSFEPPHSNPKTPSKSGIKESRATSNKNTASPSQPSRRKPTLTNSPEFEHSSKGLRYGSQTAPLPRQRTSTQTSIGSALTKPRLAGRAKAGAARNTSTPLNPHRKNANGRPRSLSASSISEMLMTDDDTLPPWSIDPSPRLYKVDPTAADVEPGYDDLILPTVARQLEAQQKARGDFLAEHNKKCGPIDVSEWDPAGTPVLVRRITPPPAPLPPTVPIPTTESPALMEQDQCVVPSPVSSRSPTPELRHSTVDERPIRPAQVDVQPPEDETIPDPPKSSPERHLSPPSPTTSSPRTSVIDPVHAWTTSPKSRGSTRPISSPPSRPHPTETLSSSSPKPKPTPPLTLPETLNEVQQLRIDDDEQIDSNDSNSAGCCKSCTIM